MYGLPTVGACLFSEGRTKHALRNALIPVVTVAGLQMGILLGGTVVVEEVFTTVKSSRKRGLCGGVRRSWRGHRTLANRGR